MIAYETIIKFFPSFLVILFNILLYESFVKTIKLKSFNKILFSFIKANFFNCLIWEIYGGVIYNIQIQFSNFFGIISFSILFFIFLYYKIEKLNIIMIFYYIFQ